MKVPHRSGQKDPTVFWGKIFCWKLFAGSVCWIVGPVEPPYGGLIIRLGISGRMHVYTDSVVDRRPLLESRTPSTGRVLQDASIVAGRVNRCRTRQLLQDASIVAGRVNTPPPPHKNHNPTTNRYHIFEASTMTTIHQF